MARIVVDQLHRNLLRSAAAIEIPITKFFMSLISLILRGAVRSVARNAVNAILPSLFCHYYVIPSDIPNLAKAPFVQLFSHTIRVIDFEIVRTRSLRYLAETVISRVWFTRHAHPLIPIKIVTLRWPTAGGIRRQSRF